jgi:hypothetical protein
MAASSRAQPSGCRPDPGRCGPCRGWGPAGDVVSRYYTISSRTDHLRLGGDRRLPGGVLGTWRRLRAKWPAVCWSRRSDGSMGWVRSRLGVGPMPTLVTGKGKPRHLAAVLVSRSSDGAEGGTRTPTGEPPLRPERSASTSSATSAAAFLVDPSLEKVNGKSREEKKRLCLVAGF